MATAVVFTAVVAGPPHVGDRSWALLADEANPLAGLPLYVNPNSAAMRASNADPSNPELAYIANTPQAYWMDQLSTPSVDAKYISTAQAAGAMPLLALYGIPNRDCGNFAAGGFGSADATGAGSTASPRRSARGRPRSSSNPTPWPWPTACPAVRARNGSI